MFARFDENPAMTLQDIKETKCYGRTHTSTDGQRENSISTTNKVCGGIKKGYSMVNLGPLKINWSKRSLGIDYHPCEFFQR